MDSQRLRRYALPRLAGLVGLLLALHPGPDGTVAAAAKAETPPPDWVEPPGFAVGCNGPVLALAALPDGRLVLGGRFRQCGGVTAANVAIWDPQLALYLPLGAGVTGGLFGTEAVVTAIHADANDIIVAGAFTTAGGAPAANIARFRIATQGWEPLGPAGNDGVNAEVTALARIDDSVYVGGAFIRAGDVAARYLARFDFATDAWTAVAGAQIATTVRALAIADRGLYVAGGTRLVSFAPVNPLSRFDLDTATWSTLATFDGRIDALAAAEGSLYVGGQFTGSGATPLARIARINLGTQVITPADSGITGGSFFGTTIAAIAVTRANVFAVGDFALAGSSVASHIAQFDRSTGRWSAIGAGPANGMDAPGAALAVPGAQGFVAGGFATAGGAPRGGVAAFEAIEVLFRDGFETVNR
jgi:hypothetical protein